MAIKKLYRVVVRQRIVWTPGTDNSLPQTTKPKETEGRSIERDVTDYIENYKFSQRRGSFAFDCTFDVINPLGLMTPSNPDSEYNRYTLNGIDTYAPIFAEGNEIQVYRIKSGLDPNVQANWKPRFRGKIRALETATSGGVDALRVTAGSALSDLVKKTLTGTFSPKMWTTSVIPANSFYTLATLKTAVAAFRDVSVPVQLPKSYTAAASIYGAPSTLQPGEIPSTLLSKLLYWDRDDIFFQNTRYFAPPYFNWAAITITTSDGSTTAITDRPSDETQTDVTPTDYTLVSSTADAVTSWTTTATRKVWNNTTKKWVEETYTVDNPDWAGNWIPVVSSTAAALWQLNAQSWFVMSGTVTKDATQIFNDSEGSLKLVSAKMKFNLTALPTGVASRILFGYKMLDTSTLNVKIQSRSYNKLTFEYGTATTVYEGTLTGPTTFDETDLGGTLVNPTATTSYQWSIGLCSLDELATTTFSSDTDTLITIYEVIFQSGGTVWIDQPAWEFLAVDKTSTGTAKFISTNILDLPRLERWTTEDGIIFKSPYPRHRVMSRTNNRVILRYWGVPYAAGTDKGFGPNNMRNRGLPETQMYEKELVEGTDFITLYEKGAIQLTNTFRRNEIFVGGTYYDLEYSDHMEASNMLKRLLIEGGVPESKIDLETTGVILSKISLSVDTTTNILKCIKDILAQLPGNYYFYEDGDANIIGRFIQQTGSPRIYAPVYQIPMAQQTGGVLEAGAEYWYGVTALMGDGKETLISNLMSTVPYQDYYDFTHSSIVTAGSIPGLQIRPVPNMKGLVIRRAKSYKTAQDVADTTTPTAVYTFEFDNTDEVVADFFEDSTLAVTFTDAAGAFSGFPIVEVITEHKTAVTKKTS